MTTPTNVTVNRRSEERIPLRCAIEVRLPGKSPLAGVTNNLSGSGALLLLPCAVPLGVELSLVIALPDGLPPLELRAIALRLETGPLGRPPVRVGTQFLMLPREIAQRILGLIYAK